MFLPSADEMLDLQGTLVMISAPVLVQRSGSIVPPTGSVPVLVLAVTIVLVSSHFPEPLHSARPSE